MWPCHNKVVILIVTRKIKIFVRDCEQDYASETSKCCMHKERLMKKNIYLKEKYKDYV